MVTAQLRLKIEALEGGARWSSSPSAGQVRAAALPLAAGPVSDVRFGSGLGRLGFEWDRSRSIWVRRVRVALAEVPLDEEVLSPARLQLLSGSVAEELDGPVVFFDLETTGLQWGTGTVPFLYGWAIASANELTVEQWLLPDLGEEAPLVKAAVQTIKEAGLLVTYNGASFDLPLLRTRIVMTGLERPWPATVHLDLLPLVRRLFRHRLTRCTLRHAEDELLGRSRVDDLPGSEAPNRYRQFLRDRDPEPLAPVLKHNLLDLVSLARLIGHLQRHVETIRPEPTDWYSLGRYAEDRGKLDRADALYLGAQSESPAPLDRAAALRRARMLRRQGQDPEARVAWRAVWDRWRDPEAAEALCVDLEHQLGDLPEALMLARDALATAPAGWDRRFAKRIWRLQARLDGRGVAVSNTAAGESTQTAAGTERPWAAWLPGGTSYEAWLTLRGRSRAGGGDGGRELVSRSRTWGTPTGN